MNRFILALLLGLAMAVSIPVQAGGRDAHHDRHHYQLSNKHHRHHNKHHRHHNKHHRHCNVRNQQYHGARHAGYERYGRYTRSYRVQSAPGPGYVIPGTELVIVYQPWAARPVGY